MENMENRHPYRLLTAKPEGKRPLGKSIHTWKNCINLDLREIGWGGMQ
jgi:hypothetical protein